MVPMAQLVYKEYKVTQELQVYKEYKVTLVQLVCKEYKVLQEQPEQMVPMARKEYKATLD